MPNARGSRGRPTIRDVAEAAGVSRALVSIVLRGAEGASGETRERVLAIADSMGYRPDRNARLLRRQRTGLVGVAIDPRQAFHADLMPHLYTAAQRRGFDLVLSGITDSRGEATAVDDLLAQRCEGIVLIGARLDATAMEEASLHAAIVCVGAWNDHADSVAVDETIAMKLIVDHLADLGHTDIVHLDGGDAPTTPYRRRGFEEAMRARGLEPRVFSAGETERAGADAVDSLLRTGLPTAIAAFNDRAAVGAVERLRHVGLAVPLDVSVTGFDDSEVAALPFHDITSATQDPPALAEAAFDLMGARMRATDAPTSGALDHTHAVVVPAITRRDSTGRPRKADAT